MTSFLISCPSAAVRYSLPSCPSAAFIITISQDGSDETKLDRNQQGGRSSMPGLPGTRVAICRDGPIDFLMKIGRGLAGHLTAAGPLCWPTLQHPGTRTTAGTRVAWSSACSQPRLYDSLAANQFSIFFVDYFFCMPARPEWNCIVKSGLTNWFCTIPVNTVRWVKLCKWKVFPSH